MYRKMAFLLLFISLYTLTGISLARETKGFVIAPDGVKIQYYAEGQGEPTIVFVHGWAGEYADWEKQLAHFSKTNQVVIVELAGFGKSGNNRTEWTMDAFGEDVAAVIKHLDLKNVVLVGHSMGAPVILEAEKRISERILSLVPVDVFKNVESKTPADQVEEMTKGAMEFANNPDKDEISSYLVREVDPEIIEKSYLYLKTHSKIGWEESFRETFRWLSDDLTGVLQKMKSPIVCINSDSSPTDIEMARKYAPKFNAKIIENVGHSIYMEAPDEFNTALSEILDELIRLK